MGLEPTFGSVDPLLMCEVEQPLGQSLGQNREILNSAIETSSACTGSGPEVRPDLGPITGPANSETLGLQNGPDIGPNMLFLPQSSMQNE